MEDFIAMDVKAKMAVGSIGFASAAAEGLRVPPARETDTVVSVVLEEVVLRVEIGGGGEIVVIVVRVVHGFAVVSSECDNIASIDIDTNGVGVFILDTGLLYPRSIRWKTAIRT